LKNSRKNAQEAQKRLFMDVLLRFLRLFAAIPFFGNSAQVVTGFGNKPRRRHMVFSVFGIRISFGFQYSDFGYLFISPL
jgi:hypothetical protein